jgi:hypothetical protein
MISMDSPDAAFLCPRCGCAAFHSNSGECIDALRRQIAELQFKKAPVVRRNFIRGESPAVTLGNVPS